MSKLFFWRNWDKSNQFFYLSLLSLFVLSIVLYFTAYFIGSSAVIHWETQTELEPSLVKIGEFTKSIFSFNVEAESYLIKQFYAASVVKINILPSYIYLLLLVIPVLYALTLSTFLKRSWYFLGTGAFILFIVNLKLELLNIFNNSNQLFTIVALGSYLLPSYYFHAFNPNISFLKRFLTFLSITIILGLLIANGAQVSGVALYLTNFGIVAPIALSALFIIIISFEIVKGFLYITTDSNTPNNKGRRLNFFFITILYLANLMLLLLKKKLYIDWDILYLDMFFLLVISAILGIWGYKKRSFLFKDTLPFKPYGAFFYLALGIITFSTIAYSFITGNDPLVESFEYMILYSHLCISTAFVFYILINFWDVFPKKISIYRVVYQPFRMPFFMVRGIGVVAVIGLVLFSNSFPFYLGLAGYYNLQGDVYNYENNYLLAKHCYDLGVTFEYQNHRSNYSLAALAEKNNDKNTAFQYYNGTLVKNPSEYSYINLSNFYKRENLFFQALFTLRDGLQRHPKSGAIANNLALLYSKTKIQDSSFYYIDIAQNYAPKKAVAASNFLFLLGKNENYTYADSVLGTLSFNDPAFASNALLIKNKLNKKDDKPFQADYLKDSSLTTKNFCYLFNYGINNLSQLNEDFRERIKRLEKDSSNYNFVEGLNFISAVDNYYNGNLATAIEKAEQIKHLSSSPAFYSKILALWMLEKDATKLSAEHFKETFSTGGQHAVLNYCFAVGESGEFDKAIPHLENLKNSKNKELAKMGNELLDIYTATSIQNYGSWNEEQKLLFLHFKKKDLKAEEIAQLYQSIHNPIYRVQAASEYLDYLISNGEIALADELSESLNLPSENKALEAGEVNYQYLRLLAAKQDWKKLDKFTKSVYLNKDKSATIYYFTALTHEGLGKTKDAEKTYVQALKKLPFYEPLAKAAVNFYNKRKATTEAYEISVKSIKLNPYSIELLQLYALQCLKLNLENYADDALKQLSLLMDPADFKKFEEKISNEKALLNQNIYLSERD